MSSGASSVTEVCFLYLSKLHFNWSFCCRAPRLNALYFMHLRTVLQWSHLCHLPQRGSFFVLLCKEVPVYDAEEDNPGPNNQLPVTSDNQEIADSKPEIADSAKALNLLISTLVNDQSQDDDNIAVDAICEMKKKALCR